MTIVISYDFESDTWTHHNGELPARQAWREAVAEIAAKAKETLPECHGRVDKAVAIVLNGDVELLPDGKAQVASQSNGTTAYFVVNGTCECRDFPKAPSGWCKHRIAAGLAKRVAARVRAPLDAPANGQAAPRQEVQIFLDAVFAQPEQPGNGGDARPTLPCGAIRIALQHGVNRHANGAHLGGVGVDDNVIKAERVGTQGNDLCHERFSCGTRSPGMVQSRVVSHQHVSAPRGPDAGKWPRAVLDRLSLWAVCVCRPCLSIPHSSLGDNPRPFARHWKPGDEGVRLVSCSRSPVVRTRGAVPAAGVVG